MRLKSPGGYLSFVTACMAIVGLVAAVVFLREGRTGLGLLFGAYSVLSGLVWFDQRWVAPPLIIFTVSLDVLAGVYVLVMRGFSWRTALRIVAGAYAAQALWRWYRHRGEAQGHALTRRSPRFPHLPD